MKNEALKRIGEDLEAKFKAWLESEETKAAIESIEKALPEDTGTFEVVITTENLDRYDEVIKLDGWDLTHYRNNPVVLWGHDHNQLIGIATSIEIRDGKLVAMGRFAPTEAGQEKRKLYELGFLRATSVGFIEKEREGNLITKAELLEFSFVAVPANPYALSLAMEKGVSINEMVTKGIFSVKTVEESPEEENDESGASEEVIEGDSEEEETPETPEEEENGGEAEEDTTDGEEGDEENEEEEDAAGAEVEEGEKHLNIKDIKTHLASIKEQVVALEELVEKDGEPEGNEPEEESEEEKRYKKFSEDRKTLQRAATVLGEVLAETRQAIEAK